MPTTIHFSPITLSITHDIQYTYICYILQITYSYWQSILINRTGTFYKTYEKWYVPCSQTINKEEETYIRYFRLIMKNSLQIY